MNPRSKINKSQQIADSSINLWYAAAVQLIVYQIANKKHTQKKNKGDNNKMLLSTGRFWPGLQLSAFTFRVPFVLAKNTMLKSTDCAHLFDFLFCAVSPKAYCHLIA